MPDPDFRTVTIGKEFYEELGDYHRHGSRHVILREAWRRYKKFLDRQEQEVKR